MKLARNYSFDDVRVEETPLPALGERDALVRVSVCGVCTGEAMPWYVNGKCPTVLGHEPVGVIESVGRSVRGFAPGERVFFHHHTSCGSCVDCRRGHPTLCEEFKSTRLDPGGFAEYARVPELNLSKDTLKIPDGVSDDAAVFIEPLACCVHALNRLNLRPGDTALVIGLGVMGLLNGQMLRRAGAKKIIGCDLREDRRRNALAEGFDAAIAPDLEAVKALTGGRGAECVIVGPPSADATGFGLKSLAPGGTVQLFAPMPADQTLAMAFDTFYFKEHTINASYSCDAADTREALRLLAAGEIRPEKYLTHRFGLDSVGAALRATLKGEGPFLKAAVYPWEVAR